MKVRRARQRTPGEVFGQDVVDTLTKPLEGPLEALARELGIAGMFGRQELAGAVLNERGLTWAGRDGKSLFLRMSPTDPLLASPGEKILRLHFNELCDRYEAGESFIPATNAELICLLHQTSLVAPLKAEALAVLKYLVKGTFLEPVMADTPTSEWWPGQTTETLNELRHRYRVGSRK